MVLAVLAVAPILQGQTYNVQQITIDPAPQNRGWGDRLEKGWGNFTSTATPSFVVGAGAYPSGNGGLWLYVPLTTSPVGTYNSPIQIGPSGAYYERLKAVRMKPTDVVDDIVASGPGGSMGGTYLFLNPGNSGGNATGGMWPYVLINPNSGCHDIDITADINGDGLVDLACSAETITGSAGFVAYQTSNIGVWDVQPNTSTGIDIGDGIVVWKDPSTGINHIIGCEDGNTWLYINPLSSGQNPATTVSWARVRIGPGAEGNSVSNLPNNLGVLVASNEESDVTPGWSYGLVQFQPPSTNALSGNWPMTEIDTTVRDAHQITSGVLPWATGTVYATYGEQGQRSAHCNPEHAASLPDIGSCRVALLTYDGSSWTTAAIVSTYGTQNQSVISWNGGLLIGGANHGVVNEYDQSVEAWFVTGGGGSSSNIIEQTISDSQALFWDSGLSQWGGTILQVYQDFGVSNPAQDWAWTQVPGGWTVCSLRVCLSDNGSQVVMGSKADVWTITNAGAVQNAATLNYIEQPNNPQNASYLSTGKTPFQWTISKTLH